MKLTGNLSLSRYEWGKLVVDEFLQPFEKDHKAVYYDIGAGEISLVSPAYSDHAFCRSFDLYPSNEATQQWDIEKVFPYDYQPADLVTLLDVVEHLNNPWLCMKNLAQIVKPGGTLLLTTPNPGWSTSRISLLAKGFLTCFTQSDLTLNHHVFIAWPHILEKLLNDAGFEVQTYVTLDGPTRLNDKGMKFSSFAFQFPARLVKKYIERADPTAIGMSYGVIARKIG
jgi:SAM-dependent methyltransferase